MARRRREHSGGIFDRPAQLLTASAVLLAIGWIWFVGNLHLHEMLLGAVVVALCTAFCHLIYKSSSLSVDFRLRDVLEIWRVPREIVKDTGILIGLLFEDLFRGRPVGSFYRVCGFRTSRRDPILIGRSALAIAYTTMSPNMIVLGIDPSQNHMLFHQVQRDSVSTLTRNLGAEG